MKTKIIPFDLETAKKIQAGEIKGKIKTRDCQDVFIVLWDKKDEDGYIILALIVKPETDLAVSYTCAGEISKGHKEELDLVLEVPDNEPQEPRFKPFDKVLCRDYGDDVWKANLFSHKAYGLSYPYYVCGGGFYRQCIPYEGNENLLGTTDKPKED